MELKKLTSRGDKRIYVHTASGHFATNHSHVNTYIDLTYIKVNHLAAKAAAAMLAEKYQNTVVETILCLEGTMMLGAYMAEALTGGDNYFTVNRDRAINVLAPELNSNKQMIFQDNTKHIIREKRIILLLSNVSTGKTINRAFDCLNYYGGVPAGIAAGFSAIREYGGVEVNAIFTEENLPGYHSWLPAACELCANKVKLDAIVNERGFTVI